MKIIIAPDSFKGSLLALEAAMSIQRGIKNLDDGIETVMVPMADGGEGTVQSIALAGSLGEGYQTLYSKVFDGIFSIIDRPMSLQEAIDNAVLLLENSAENVLRLWNNKKV